MYFMLMQTLLCAGKTQIYDERGSQNHIHWWCVWLPVTCELVEAHIFTPFLENGSYPHCEYI